MIESDSESLFYYAFNYRNASVEDADEWFKALERLVNKEIEYYKQNRNDALELVLSTIRKNEELEKKLSNYYNL